MVDTMTIQSRRGGRDGEEEEGGGFRGEVEGKSPPLSPLSPR